VSTKPGKQETVERVCARCARTFRGLHWVKPWPEGYLCPTCHTWALETYGQCIGCGTERMTPGLAPEGGRLCVDCAGIPGDYHCGRCGREARRQVQDLCARCVLTERLHDLLNDGTGQLRPELVSFAEGFCGMARPRSGLTWIGNQHVQQLLRTLADPSTPITHELLNGLSPWRSVAHLRDLLMLHGVLPHVDRHLMLFQRWLCDTLAGVKRREHRQVLERFAAWHVQRRLHQFAERGPLRESQTARAARRFGTLPPS
jgi:hypothetical protein